MERLYWLMEVACANSHHWEFGVREGFCMTHRLGIWLLTFANISFKGLGEVSRLGEELGYGRVYTTESLTDTLAINQLIATYTSKIEIGSSVAIIYLRHASMAAQGAVAISEISGGRYILGLGLGHPPRMRAMGIEPGNPLEDMRKYVSEIRGVLEGEPVYPLPVQTYQGEELKFRRSNYPVRIYMAAVGPKMTELGGEIADGLLPYMVPLSRMGAYLEAKDAGAKRAGRDPQDVKIDLGVHTFLCDDLTAAREAARKTLTYWLGLPAYNNSIRESGYEQEAESIKRAFERGDQTALRDGITDAIIDEFCLVGPPERCRERLAAFYDAGVDMPALMIDPVLAGESYQKAVERTLRALAPR